MKKRTYITPQIEQIVLDNEISLALESTGTPPTAPGEPVVVGFGAPEYFNNNPFNSNLG
jgi:hypothetical protein